MYLHRAFNGSSSRPVGADPDPMLVRGFRNGHAATSRVLLIRYNAPLEILEQPFLLLQVPERPNVRDRKSKPVRRVVANAKINPPVFHAEPAAIRVIRRLHNGKFLYSNSEVDRKS